MEEKRKATEAAPSTQCKGSDFSLHLQGNGNVFDAAITQALRNSAEQGLHLPIDGFPPLVQDYIKTITDTYQTNRDAVVSSCMFTAGNAAGKGITIHDGRYFNKCLLFVCYVAPSGCNKSETIKAPLIPIFALNSQEFAGYDTRLSEWKSIPKNKDPRPQPKPIIFGSDSTQESITLGLRERETGAAIISDELFTYFANIQRYNKNGGESFLLSVFDSSPIVVTRKGDDSFLIENPFLSIIGTTQPQTLKRIFSESSMSAGLPQRFLFVYQQEATMTPYNERSLDRGSVERWGNLIVRIFNSPARTLEIKDGAKAVYIDFYNQLQEKKVSANAYMCAVYSKLQIIVERLAGIIHLLNENPTDLITADEMRFACSLMPYFERTQTLVYNTLVGDASTSLSKAEIVRQLFANFDCVSQNAVAMAIGIDRGNLSKMLKK